MFASIYCVYVAVLYVQCNVIYFYGRPVEYGRPLYFCPVVSSSIFFLFFLAYSQLSQIWCLPYFHTWCGLSANLRCRSELCCTWIAENIGRKKSPKNSPSGHHCTNLSGYIFPTKARIDNREKNLLNSSISPMSSQYGELRPTSAWGRFGCLGHASEFQRVSHLGSFTARHSSSGRQPNCGVEQRAPPVFGRAAVTLGIGPHSSLFCFFCCYNAEMM